MIQCCGCDRLFSTQQAVKTHIRLKIKNNKGELVFGKGPPGGRLRPGRGADGEPLPGPAAAGHGTGTQVPRQAIHSAEDCYFQKGLHTLSWQGA